MLFPLGQSSNSDVDVGFPRAQHCSARDFIGRRAAVKFLLWRGFGVHLRVKVVLWLGFGVQLRLTSHKVLVKV